jgi:sugar-phosphatase
VKEFHFQGCLFDLDGTLIDSMAAVHRSWSALAVKHGLDPDRVLKLIHGRPARESVAEFLANKGPTVIEQEVLWLKNRESQDTQDITPLPGAIAFLHQLDAFKIPWAIVTSGCNSVATARIAAAGLPQPEVLITADHITHGKPDPEPYLLGANQLGLPPESCLVFEDAPAGIQAGLAAQSRVIGVLTHATPEALMNVDCIDDYLHMTVSPVTVNPETVNPEQYSYRLSLPVHQH